MDLSFGVCLGCILGLFISITVALCASDTETFKAIDKTIASKIRSRYENLD